MIGAIRRRAARARQGQSMVEMLLILPILLMLTLGTLEFGIAFDHHLTLEYATREGARTGAALSNGDGDSALCDTIDAQIVAAVQRVLTSPGSDVDMAEISEVRIFKAGADGQELGPVNIWHYAAGLGPTVDGAALDFVQFTSAWAPCSRVSDPVPDSIGVSLVYAYDFRTPVTSIIGIDRTTMHDRTIMPLSPTDF